MVRLREIKPGMKIHCNTKAEWCQLKEVLTSEGYIGCSYFVTLRNDCYVEIKENKLHAWGHIVNEKCIEFSDLIIPELSAEEVLRICHEICRGKDCEICEMGKNCYAGDEPDFKKVVAICEQWKADHEKKEPELEWVDICRIIEIQNNGFKKCVHEEDMKPNEGSDYIPEVRAERFLFDYISSHDGKYIAVVERVCRVKK